MLVWLSPEVRWTDKRQQSCGLYNRHISTLELHLTENVEMAKWLSVQSLMELAVVDSEPAIFQSIENINITLTEADVGMIVRPSGMHRLRRNDVISSDHNHK